MNSRRFRLHLGQRRGRCLRIGVISGIDSPDRGEIVVETKAINGIAKTRSPEETARLFVRGVERGSYLVLPGLTNKILYHLEGLLPEQIVWRGKQGYSLPVKNWLREGLKEPLIAVLNESPVIQEYMNRSYIDQLIREHMARTHNHNHILWALLNLGLWYKKFFE